MDREYAKVKAFKIKHLYTKKTCGFVVYVITYTIRPHIYQNCVGKTVFGDIPRYRDTMWWVFVQVQINFI